MEVSKLPSLRRGWTTGACATAAVRAALTQLWGGLQLDQVQITLPKGEQPIFQIAHRDSRNGWVEIGITKDAGDDPDVTHGALIIARVSTSDSGINFHAGEGVGTITKAGLPIAVGEAAINPVPRKMMTAQIEELANLYSCFENRYHYHYSWGGCGCSKDVEPKAWDRGGAVSFGDYRHSTTIFLCSLDCLDTPRH